MPTEKSITLTKKQLHILWEKAQLNFDDFQEALSGNFIEKINNIENSAEYILEELVHAIQKGNFNEFKQNFDKKMVDVNVLYTKGDESRSLLQLLIEHNYDKNNEATAQRVEITRYLLEQGADVNLMSQDTSGFNYPTPATLCQDKKFHQIARQESQKNVIGFFAYNIGRIFSDFADGPIIAAIDEYIENKKAAQPS